MLGDWQENCASKRLPTLPAYCVFALRVSKLQTGGSFDVSVLARELSILALLKGRS